LLSNNFTEEKYHNKYLRLWPVVCTLALFIFSTSSLPGARAIIDIDTSGDGSAAAFDGEESIATDGDSFCSIANDIAGGKFSSLFEGIVGDCDNNSQFLVEYSYSKNHVKTSEKTYITITVKDKETGNPISDALVKLAIGPTQPSFGVSTGLAAAAAGKTSTQVADDKTVQTMYTDTNGRAAFTVQLGPKSDIGAYDAEIEVTKDTYQSGFEQTNLRVV
jgi:hypothetical protein